jgi:hypothetical protein
MPVGKPPDRWRMRLDRLRTRVELLVSGRAPSDPLYLTNRTWGAKLKIALLIAVPVLLLVALAVIGAANRVQVGAGDPYGQPPSEAAPVADAAAPSATGKPSPDPVLGSTDLEVLNIRIARDAHSPVVTGIVRNKTDRKVDKAEVSYFLVDREGSLVGTDSVIVASVQPHGSVAFRNPLKLARAEYVFVRDARPN